MQLNATSGRDTAIRATTSPTCPASVSALFKNLSRAGRLKNICSTQITVPIGIPQALTSRTLPPSMIISVPSREPSSRVVSEKRETEAIEGSASPRKPSVKIFSKSLSTLILLVAWRSSDKSASSLDMPWPLSVTHIFRLPPAVIAMDTSVAPASREFSINSFITDAGRSTTSPAAILLVRFSGRIEIRWDMSAPAFYEKRAGIPLFYILK